MNCPFCGVRLQKIAAICPDCKTLLPSSNLFILYAQELDKNSVLALPENRVKLDRLVQESLDIRNSLKAEAQKREVIQLEVEREKKRLEDDLAEKKLEIYEKELQNRLEIVRKRKKKRKKILIILSPFLLSILMLISLFEKDMVLRHEGHKVEPLLRKSIEKFNLNYVPVFKVPSSDGDVKHLAYQFQDMLTSDWPGWYKTNSESDCLVANPAVYKFEPNYSKIVPLDWLPPHRIWLTPISSKPLLGELLSEGDGHNSSSYALGKGIYEVPVRITTHGVNRKPKITNNKMHFAVTDSGKIYFFFTWCGLQGGEK